MRSPGSTRPAPHSRHSSRFYSEIRPYRDGWVYRLLKVSCGKKRCRKCRGTRAAHGPYWYAEKRSQLVGKGTITRYIGKVLKSVAEKHAERQAREEAKKAGGVDRRSLTHERLRGP